MSDIFLIIIALKLKFGFDLLMM